MLVPALGLEAARLISLCGAGGKTSLMFALARELAAAGECVLVTTTTRIAQSEAAGPWAVVTAAGADEIVAQARRALRARGSEGVAIAVSGGRDEGRKLAGFPPECIDAVARQPGFDRILVEADGSRRAPLKAPAAHEPVIPTTTDAVIIVAGLSGLGRPLDEATVFRAGLWAARTGLAPEAPVSADSLARMVVHAEGLARGAPDGARRVLFLNQADTERRVDDAKRVIRALADAERRPARVVVGCLRPTPRIAEVLVF